MAVFYTGFGFRTGLRRVGGNTKSEESGTAVEEAKSSQTRVFTGMKIQIKSSEHPLLGLGFFTGINIHIKNENNVET